MKRKRPPKQVEAYTDETGHTGLNLFDPVQPWFWTGTLLSPADTQVRGATLFQRLSASVGASVLHAKDLGLLTIEQFIAEPLREFLEEIGARFVFTGIEKRHLASTKLADAILDSTMNKAVSGIHYGVHGLRLMLAHAVEELTEPLDQEDFWKVYATGDGKGLASILGRLSVRLSTIPVQPRMREILSDAFKWGASHPGELLEFERHPLDAPNLVAMSLLMDGIHEILQGTGLKVGRFVHDEQQQFGKFMEEAYSVLRRLTKATHASALITDLTPINTYKCKIEIIPSHGVVGLQAIDVVLWLYRRSMSDGMRTSRKCAALVEFVDAHANVHYHSKAQLTRDAERAYQEIMSLPIDADALRKGKEEMAEDERARKQRTID